MTARLLLPFAMVVSSCSQANTLERQQREEGVYAISGDPKALADFHRNVGIPWTGGEVIDSDPSDGKISYWPYPTRTAAEARALMMPVMMSGLDLDIQDYDETSEFAAERKVLDDIAMKCSAKADPFFITPMRSVQITPLEDASLRECLKVGVEKAKMPVWTLRQTLLTP